MLGTSSSVAGKNMLLLPLAAQGKAQAHHERVGFVEPRWRLEASGEGSSFRRASHIWRDWAPAIVQGISAVTMATVQDGKHSFDDRGATAGMRKWRSFLCWR